VELYSENNGFSNDAIVTNVNFLVEEGSINFVKLATWRQLVRQLRPVAPHDRVHLVANSLDPSWESHHAILAPIRPHGLALGGLVVV
jgi:hypothetical protein